MEIKREAEEKKLHGMAKVHNLLEMWQGSQNLRATQKESHAQNKQMTAIGYISYTKEIVKASWSDFQHDGAAYRDEPVKTIDWLSLSLRWHVAYIVAPSPNPKPRDDVLYKDSVKHSCI